MPTVARATGGFSGGGLLLLCISVIREIVPENRFELYTKINLEMVFLCHHASYEHRIHSPHLYSTEQI
ncbi:hypothetical protein K502DRAFT_345276 [Neoconidiobolus thromboides FSU 785]|nr:hypothetical protein K502DRAFT_345276 [Neoconidiobolus thromboides FSU 785]